MNQEFVTYEQSLTLKELGFDEPCFGYYNIDPQLKSPAFNLVKPFEHEWCLPAPLKQQVFRWFREKHGLFHDVSTDSNEGKITFYIIVTKVIEFFQKNVKTTGLGVQFEKFDIPTYEEAESDCIDKLIEMVKNK